MGRTVHYRTLEKVSESDFEVLLNSIRKINSRFDWTMEELKLWREFALEDLDFVWGFTKVDNETEANMVIDSIRKLSCEVIGITWLVLDEGIFRKTLSEIKNGNLVAFKILED